MSSADIKTEAVPPEVAVVLKLKQKGWHIAFGESCTGGLAAARIISVPDASYVLDASVVTYSNAAKIKYLGVLPQTLNAFGAVSEQVASEMAYGAAKNNGAEIGVGISGIAGPGGGTPEKPVGVVCFGFYVDGRRFTETRHFGDIGRNAVREACVTFVCETLRVLPELRG